MFKKLGTLFSGASNRKTDPGIYLYVKLDHSNEIVRIRLQPAYDLNQDYDQGGYISRKLVVGPHTFKKAEATFYFTPDRSLASADITGGELSDEAAWQTYEAANKIQET